MRHEMAATESRTTVGEAHDMNMGGGEGTDICKSVDETDEVAATVRTGLLWRRLRDPK